MGTIFEQLFLCKDCGKRYREHSSDFYHDGRTPKVIIEYAVGLVKEGWPYRLVRIHVFKRFKRNVSWGSVGKWARRYG